MKKIILMIFIMMITVNISFGISIVDVACGSYHTVLLAEDGTVWTMGLNGVGQCGHSTNETTIGQPRQILNIPKIKKISAGGNVTMLIDEEDNLYATQSDGNLYMLESDCNDAVVRHNNDQGGVDRSWVAAVLKTDGTIKIKAEGRCDDFLEGMGCKPSEKKVIFEDGTEVTDAKEISFIADYYGLYQQIRLACILEDGSFYISTYGGAKASNYMYEDNIHKNMQLALASNKANASDSYANGRTSTSSGYNIITLRKEDDGRIYRQRSNTESGILESGYINLWGEEIVDASIGYNHYIFLTSDGKVYAMGNNTYEQLGLINEEDGTIEMIDGSYGSSGNYLTWHGILRKGNMIEWVNMQLTHVNGSYSIDLTNKLPGSISKYFSVPTLIESLQEIVPNEQSSLAYITSDARVWIGGMANFSLMFEVKEDMTLRNTSTHLNDIFTNGALNIKVYDKNNVHQSQAVGCVYNIYEDGLQITHSITPNFVFKSGKTYQLECGIGNCFNVLGDTYTIKFEGMNASKVKDGVVTSMRAGVNIAKFILKVYVTELANLT